MHKALAKLEKIEKPLAGAEPVSSPAGPPALVPTTQTPAAMAAPKAAPTATPSQVHSLTMMVLSDPEGVYAYVQSCWLVKCSDGFENASMHF